MKLRSSTNFFSSNSDFDYITISYHQGVYRRFLRGNSSQDSAKFVEATIQPMASAGLNVALRFVAYVRGQVIELDWNWNCTY